MIFPKENAIFYKIDIFDRNTKNHWKKPSRNPSKILPKSQKITKNPSQIAKNRLTNPNSVQKASKKRSRGEKMRKMTPRGSQKELTKSTVGLRVPLPADHLSWKNAGKSLGVHGSSRVGVDPRALWRFADQRGGPI